MEGISYLSQQEAAQIDETLMGPLGFSVDQSMELAGLSVSCAVAQASIQCSHPETGIMSESSSGRSQDFCCCLIDIPCVWHVEEGDSCGEGIKPDMLVCSSASLTAPKLCAKKFSGPHHFLGGRFVPLAIAGKYKLCLPEYPGTSMCVRVGGPPQLDISSLRENYVSPALLEDQVDADPFDQFRKWFNDAIAAGLKEPNAMALSTASMDGKISSRMVLLKGVDKNDLRG